MTKPTREQKRKHLEAVHKWKEDYGFRVFDPVELAILADYTLSEERRAELEWRRSEISMLWQQSLELYAKAKTDEERDGHASDLGSFEAWRLEIDAELEGGDG